MDAELKAWTGIGVFEKTKANFREIERRLRALERQNRYLRERLAAIEAHVSSPPTEDLEETSDQQ